METQTEEEKEEKKKTRSFSFILEFRMTNPKYKDLEKKNHINLPMVKQLNIFSRPEDSSK